MDNRKRSRYEIINMDNNNSNDNIQGVASTSNNLGTATIATIEGQSYILSNSSNCPLPANILLSICEDTSDGTEEYIVDHSLLSPLKQEQPIAAHTNNNQSQLQQTGLVTGPPPQLRIVNQAGKTLNTSSFNPTIINGNTINASSLNSINLPPGCEIYVIKEVFDTPKHMIAESTTTTSPNNKTTAPATVNNIKLEQTSTTPVQHRLIHDNNSLRNLNNNSTFSINTNSPITSTSIATPNAPDDTTKRSLILEAYKKRDDRRRATHNEVERRRRDKINSWIFKLKEMLPAEQTSSTTSTRSPSSDSKSQILIRACEYVKSMQEEMNSLRECLTENERLRLKNERLQEEINSLRAKQQQKRKSYNNNNNNLLLTSNAINNSNNSNNNSGHNSDNSDSCEITLNSLNATYANVQLFNPSSTHHHLVDLVGLTNGPNGTSSASNSVNVKYAKRELIITDYVD